MKSSFTQQRMQQPRSGSTITNGREPRSCLGRVFNSKLGCIATPGSKCMVCMHAATSKVENLAQGSSCKLKFVHAKVHAANSCPTAQSAQKLNSLVTLSKTEWKFGAFQEIGNLLKRMGQQQPPWRYTICPNSKISKSKSLNFVNIWRRHRPNLLNVILLNAILLCVILQNAILLCVILFIIFMLSVIPFKCHSSFYCVILFNNTRLLCVILFNNARLLCVILLCRCA